MSALPVFLKNASRQVKTDLNRFRRDEDGGLIVFSLLVLISMLVLGGMAVDFMRQENQRVVLQGVADRSVLSAASLQQTINGQELVEDYFLKSGVSNTIVGTPGFEDTGNSKRVSVRAERELDTFFLRLIGIDTLSSVASANAIEASGKVEISLVVDVSASMRTGGTGRIQEPASDGTENEATSLANGGRIGALRRAALAFAETVLDPVYEGQVSLNIIPFGGHVNPGPEMFELLGGTGKNLHTTDPDDFFSGDDFAVPFDAILPGKALNAITIEEDTSTGDYVFVLNNPDIISIRTQQVDITDPGYTGPVNLRYSQGGDVSIDGTTITNEMVTRIVRALPDDPDTPDVDETGYIDLLPLEIAALTHPLDFNGTDVFIDPDVSRTPQVRYSPPHSCYNMEQATDWTTPGPPAVGQSIVPNFMRYGFGRWEIEYGARNWGWCPQDETVIKYALQDADEARDYIAGLSLYDGTGTDMAIKWGLATLDPDMQPYFEDLNALNSIGNELVPDDFVNRPAPYDDNETRKILVLMTDGQVTAQLRPVNPNNVRNILDVTPNQRDNPRNWQGWIVTNGNSDGDTSIKNRSDARDNIVDICTLAKAEGRDVKVFTVAFEYQGNVSQDDIDAMTDCASPTTAADPTQYYFATSGDGLTDVFQQIAEQISDLRLTE